MAVKENYPYFFGVGQTYSERVAKFNRVFSDVNSQSIAPAMILGRQWLSYIYIPRLSLSRLLKTYQ